MTTDTDIFDTSIGTSTVASIKEMVCEVITTHVQELSCAECFELVERYAEIKLRGECAAKAMPLVHEHLERCGDCREEFDLLLEAIRASRL